MSTPATEAPKAPAAPTADAPKAEAPATPPAGDPPKPEAPGDKPLGPNGEKALQAERDARKELEKKLAALAPLEKLAAALGGGDAAKGKSEIEQLTERQAKFEEDVATEREARWRAEVANEKGLTAVQAGRLKGATREELAADADKLVTDFGITPGKPGTPKPDPSQGARPGVTDIDAQIAEATKARDFIRVIALREQKAAAAKTKP